MSLNMFDASSPAGVARNFDIRERAGSLGSLGRLGSLEVRLTRNCEEVWQAQRLRHQVFLETRGLTAQSDCQNPPIDQDRYDAHCDHMIVLDHATGGRIIGTYRLLGQEKAVQTDGFYSASYFETDQLVARKRAKRFLELGRSCVRPEYRTKRTVECLWQGIWNYCSQHHYDVLIGCASFSSAIPENHAAELSFLSHFCQADADWSVSAKPSRFHTMRLMPEISIDARVAFSLLPPLVKGYLRVGAKVGDGCVIDPELETTVVMIILPLEFVASRYAQHFGAESRRLVA
jgi:L-ornithine Nalpha-acyltransferase